MKTILRLYEQLQNHNKVAHSRQLNVTNVVSDVRVDCYNVPNGMVAPPSIAGDEGWLGEWENKVIQPKMPHTVWV